MVTDFRCRIWLTVVGLALITSAKAVLSQTFPLPCSTTGASATNLVVCSASYLGGNTNDIGTAVALAPDRTVALGGTIIGKNFGKVPFNLQAGSSTTSGGNGVIIRTDQTGKYILSVTRLGNVIDGIDINRTNGEIAVIGDFGLAQLSPKGNFVYWSKKTTELGSGTGGGAVTNNGRRIAVGNDGTVATLFNKTITVFDGLGNKKGQFTVQPNGQYQSFEFNVEDVAVDSANNSVIVTGFTQKNEGKCGTLQVAFIRSYSYTGGNPKWTNYDWTPQQAYIGNGKDVNDHSCADTRGDRIALGRDNMLYFAGESAGGNNIYRYNPNNISQDAPNVYSDAYNTTYQSTANHITYYARLDPKTGNEQKGQYALARLSKDGSGINNTIVPRAITADESGNVYIGGISYYAIPNRDPVNLSISGKPLGIYSGGDGFILVVSPNFSSRKIWTAWTGANTSSQPTIINSVAVAKGVAAIIATAQGNMITVNPVQSTNNSGNSAFFSVFSALP